MESAVRDPAVGVDGGRLVRRAGAGAGRAPGRAARLDAAVGGREPRHARLLQVRHVPARATSAALVGGARDFDTQPPAFDIVLPVGISFYTFATMSYTLDVYLRRAAPARNFLDYALFVTFFPHLVAGPIMRPTELVPQFATPRQRDARHAALRARADDARAVPEDRAGRQLPRRAPRKWSTTATRCRARSMRGSGRSRSAARSSATSRAIRRPRSARRCASVSRCRTTSAFPYAAVGFSDFWRRWHITLSSWLRDYLYIPLGGNRHGRRAPTSR